MTNDDNAMNHDAWFAGLCAQAEELRQELADLTIQDEYDRLKSIVDRNAVVIGIWPNENGKGYGRAIIKGASILQRIAGSAEAEIVTTAAIPCTCLSDAISASHAFGDMSDEASGTFH